MNMKNFKLNKKYDSGGFTLVEVIIGIGISSLLTGLMLPSFLNLISWVMKPFWAFEIDEVIVILI